jgi:hypothetical protein
VILAVLARLRGLVSLWASGVPGEPPVTGSAAAGYIYAAAGVVHACRDGRGRRVDRRVRGARDGHNENSDDEPERSGQARIAHLRTSVGYLRTVRNFVGDGLLAVGQPE